MKEKITFKEKSVYGTIRIYPVCEKAFVVTKLMATKTVSVYDLDVIRQLGFEVELIKLP